jgi:glycosyltransferase involved in cell wall biosynthesis
MALAAIIIGKIHKIPVILDMAEPYPEMLRLIWKFEPFKFPNIFVRNPFLADIIEKITLKHVDHVFAMIEESKNRLVSKGVSPDKISIVSNTPILRRFQEAKATFPGTLDKHKGKLILLYVGLLNLSRGLDTVLESLSHFIKINDNFFLVLLGTGNAVEHLKSMAKKLKIENHVGFEGWVDNKLVPEYVASSDICIVPHHKCGHWDNTIPNKLFDYMAAGKPVLVSNVKPMERMVQETDSGLIYKDYDKESFVSQLAKLQDMEVRNKLGRNGAKAVQEYYNWDNDSAVMLKGIKMVLEQ